jgi:FlaA1/EpsC-like NDP-sugar epimerase
MNNKFEEYKGKVILITGGAGCVGSNLTQKFHESELQKAKEKVLKYYPKKEVVLAFAKLVDEGNNIEFIQI